MANNKKSILSPAEKGAVVKANAKTVYTDEDGNVLATDLDFFETEIRRLQE